MIAGLLKAGVAQLVERNLAKVEVASSRLVSRSRFSGKLFSCERSGTTRFAIHIAAGSGFGAIAKRLCSGLQIRLAQFDSGSRLQPPYPMRVFGFKNLLATRRRSATLLTG